MNALLNALGDPLWSPYGVGIGIGVFSWVAFLLCNHPLGVSTAFARTAGMLERAVRGPQVSDRPYYREHKPVIDWEWMLVAGLFAGALTSAWLSGSIQWRWVPPLWEQAFGPSSVLRVAVALFGGVCVGFGARWGCGCTSGHGISGTMQLVLASWLAAACFFTGGVAAAWILFRIL